MCENIRDSFLDEIGNYYTKGEMPSRISINMRRALSEHKKRLQAKGITYNVGFERTADDCSGNSSFRSIDLSSGRCTRKHAVAMLKNLLGLHHLL